VLDLARDFSWPFHRAHWRRTALVVGGVAIGVALIVGIRVINTSVRASFQATLERIAGPVALQVTLAGGEIGFAEDVADAVRDDPDAEAAVPLVRGTIALADEPTRALQLFGVDFVAEEDLRRYEVTTLTERQELLRAFEDPSTVLVPRRLATRENLTVGDALVVTTPNGIETLYVRGLLEPGGLGAVFGGDLVVMDLPAAQLLLGKPGRIDQIDIMLRDGADVSRVATRLAATLPAGLTVARPEHRGRYYESVLASFQAMLTGLSSLCLVAGLFIIFNTTSTAAVQRGFVMARLRLLGAKQAQLFRLMMAEALALGVLGSVLGVVMGIPLAWILAGTITDSMGVIFQLRFPFERLALVPGELTAIALLGTTVALVASFFAARRLARLHPLDAVRSSGEPPTETPRLSRFLLWWLALVSTAGAAFFVEHHAHSIAWGNFGSTVWNASVIVIATPLLVGLGRVLARVLPTWFGSAGDVAVGGLLRAPGRTGVTIAAIALVVTVAITLSSLVVSCREALRSYFAGVLAADLVVSAVSTEGGWLETPVREDVAEAIAGVPGVARVDTMRILAGQDFRGARIGLLGLSAGGLAEDRYPDGWFREGDPRTAAPALEAAEAALVSMSLSDRFALHAGDTIELVTPRGPLALPIVGVVPDYVSDRGSVILNRSLVRDFWADTLINRVQVFLAPGAARTAVRTAIQEALGDRYRLKVLSLSELLDYHTGMINRAFAVMHSIQLLILIVTIAGILDLLLARIAEREREIALWRVVGAGRQALRRAVLVESGVIGALGAVLGVAVGVVTAWLWVEVHFRHLLGYYVAFAFAYGATLWYVALVSLMTLLAGTLAARHAMSRSILTGIHAE
jgi:putative ABC transport system permease protein